MPGWAFGVAPAAMARQRSHTQTRPPVSGGVSTKRLNIARRVQTTGLLSTEEALELRQIFDHYDSDGTDELDKSELGELMAALNDGIEPKKEEVQEVMKLFDKSETKGLRFEEFRKAMMYWYQNTHAKDHIFANATVHERRKKAVEAVRKRTNSASHELPADERQLLSDIFDKYDIDKSNEISPAELAGMMADLNGGIPPTAEEVKLVMWSCDLGQSGKLSRFEFERAITFWYAQTCPGADGPDIADLDTLLKSEPEARKASVVEHSRCCCIA